MKIIAILLALALSGCVTFGSTGWIAQHSLEIGQVTAVAAAVSQVEGAAVNGVTLAEKIKQ